MLAHGELAATPQPGNRRKGWRFWALAGFASCGAVGAVFCGYVAVEARVNREFFANQAAETLRSVLGPNLVSRVESHVYTTREWFRRRLFARPGIVDPSIARWLVEPLTRSERPDVVASRPPDVRPLIASPSLGNEGKWEPIRERIKGLWIARVRANPEDASVSATLIAVDLTQLELTYIPDNSATRDDALSRIPRDHWRDLVAVFNGGFRGHHTDTGERKNGAEYHRLRPRRGSIIIEAGEARIGAWSEELAAKYPEADVRQNLDPLLANGLFTPGFLEYERLDFPTLRSGVGVTSDQRWMIFAGGDHMRPKELAAALRLAGCSDAVHLDQNKGNVYFELARLGTSPPQFEEVAAALSHVKWQKFLEGSNRDFFFLTTRRP